MGINEPRGLTGDSGADGPAPRGVVKSPSMLEVGSDGEDVRAEQVEGTC